MHGPLGTCQILDIACFSSLGVARDRLCQSKKCLAPGPTTEFSDRLLAKALSIRLGRRDLPQFFEPVEDNVDPEGRRLLWFLDHQESTVTCDVIASIVDAGQKPSLEQFLCVAHLEHRCGPDCCGHHSVAAAVEQFRSVP